MKASNNKPVKTLPVPSDHTVTVKPRTNRKAAIPGLKSKKRDNIFSKSRDIREDRGTRQAKSANHSQTFSHGR